MTCPSERSHAWFIWGVPLVNTRKSPDVDLPRNWCGSPASRAFPIRAAQGCYSLLPATRKRQNRRHGHPKIIRFHSEKSWRFRGFPPKKSTAGACHWEPAVSMRNQNQIESDRIRNPQLPSSNLRAAEIVIPHVPVQNAFLLLTSNDPLTTQWDNRQTPGSG